MLKVASAASFRFYSHNRASNWQLSKLKELYASSKQKMTRKVVSKELSKLNRNGTVQKSRLFSIKPLMNQLYNRIKEYCESAKKLLFSVMPVKAALQKVPSQDELENSLNSLNFASAEPPAPNDFSMIDLKDYSDVEFVIICAKHLEYILTNYFDAVGRGLHEKARNLKGMDKIILNYLLQIAAVRNAAVHTLKSSQLCRKTITMKYKNSLIYFSLINDIYIRNPSLPFRKLDAKLKQKLHGEMSNNAIK